MFHTFSSFFILLACSGINPFHQLIIIAFAYLYLGSLVYERQTVYKRLNIFKMYLASLKCCIRNLLKWIEFMEKNTSAIKQINVPLNSRQNSWDSNCGCHYFDIFSRERGSIAATASKWKEDLRNGDVSAIFGRK